MNEDQPANKSLSPWAILTLTVLAPLVGANSVFAQGQAQCSDPSINNLVHVPGTKTVPLGKLGHVERRGKGSVPMILIPGAAFDWTIWDSFMSRNVGRYTMFAVTPQGYGGTPPPPMPPGLDYSKTPWTDALISAIVDLIEREKLDRPIIVGHHMHGDHYALRVGLEHPDKVRGVVVVAGTPSKAFPGQGNAKGKPLVFASRTQRLDMVHGYWLSSYRNVTPAMWRAGSFQASLFCKNEHRARELFAQQVSVPIPTQVRYAMEFMTADTASRLASLRVPLLVVQPRIKWTFARAMEAMRESNEMMFAVPQQAETLHRQLFQSFWGDVETGVRQTFDGGYQWEQVRKTVPNMRMEYVDRSEIFVMEDQPEKLDTIIQSFVKSVVAG